VAQAPTEEQVISLRKTLKLPMLVKSPTTVRKDDSKSDSKSAPAPAKIVQEMKNTNQNEEKGADNSQGEYLENMVGKGGTVLNVQGPMQLVAGYTSRKPTALHPATPRGI